MKRSVAAVALALAGLYGLAQSQSPAAPEKVSAEQLTAMLADDAGKDDAHLAAELQGLQLTERLGAGRLARLNAALPGEKSREALVILADSAALLGPAQADTVANPNPDAAALRQMLVNVVNYANGALHGLPNFVATRATIAFEDRPKEDVLGSTGIVSYSYLPLHMVKRDSAEVTYRNGKEVLEASGKDERKSSLAHGLQTAGEFGPFLNTVLADAVKGKITWARWEQGTDGTDGVFHYEVRKDASHYVVQFCCISEDVSESIATHVYSEKAGYHGEIVFNPTTGAVHRISVEAELVPGELVEGAGMVVEYAPVLVGSKTVVLPVRSASILRAHTTAPPEGMHMAVFKGPAKTFLNDVAFENYREFRGEMRIVSDPAGPSNQ
ncbi:MAG TPA: hypothetical protein VKB38_21895 [Terracidiphilus sp.]|nr:hypothetical protein [Terracidiphilus sp.]